MAEKKDNAPPTVVFKFNWLCDCEGCNTKIKNAVCCAKDFKVDWTAYKLTVIGKVDPAKVLDNLKKEFPMKKVEIVPPQRKKDAGGGNKKKTDKKESVDKKEQDKKPKEKKVEIVPTQPKKDAAASNKKPGDKQDKKAVKEKSNDRKDQDKKLKEKELTKVKRVKEKVELINVRQVTEIQVVKISREWVVEGRK